MTYITAFVNVHVTTGREFEHWYVYITNGSCIHSSSQTEQYKKKIDDKGINGNGKQVIKAVYGYLLSFNMRDNHPFMKLLPHTDKG